MNCYSIDLNDIHLCFYGLSVREKKIKMMNDFCIHLYRLNAFLFVTQKHTLSVLRY